jgi:hypothetical protein
LPIKNIAIPSQFPSYSWIPTLGKNKTKQKAQRQIGALGPIPSSTEKKQDKKANNGIYEYLPLCTYHSLECHVKRKKELTIIAHREKDEFLKE